MKRTRISTEFMPYALILAASALWAVWGGVIGMTGIDPIIIPFVSSGCAFFILSFRRMWSGKKLVIHRKDYILYALLGTTIIGSNLTIYPSFKYIPPVEATFIHYLAPVLLVVIDRYFFRARIKQYSLIALVLATLGATIILFGDTGAANMPKFNFGVVLALASAVFYACNIAVSKILLARYDEWTIIFVMNGMCGVLLPPLFVSVPDAFTFHSMIVIIPLGIVTSLVAVGMYLKGLKRMHTHTAGLLSYSEIFFAGLWSFVLVGNVPTRWTLFGGCFILLSGCLLYFGKRAALSAVNIEQIRIQSSKEVV